MGDLEDLFNMAVDLGRIDARMDAQLAEIKTLRAENERLQKLFDTQRELYEASVKRVEELEKELKWAWSNQKHKDHHITLKMIDSAIVRVGKLYDSTPPLAALWTGFAKLHIFKCEGCGGENRKWVTAGACLDCARWGSKGWVIGDEDD